MKKQILLLSCIFSLGQAYNQSVLYFNFVSHNEETTQWNGVPYYTANRTRVINLATYFQTNGITWNLQSDWVYLSNVLTQETPAFIATTGGKNILRYLYEDLGVEIDPHGHETVYIYPDLVHLMDSIGLPESKVMGGTIYDGTNGINSWMNMSNGENGVIFPWAFWQPDYLWGAGTPGHTNDPKYFGVWNPEDTTNFLTHNTSQHIRYLATGCAIKVKDTSVVVNVVNQIRDVIEYVEDQTYPANGFYMQTIFFQQGALNNAAFYNKVVEIADSVDQLVATGHGQWKTLKQMYILWETAYSSQMFQWECGDYLGIEEEVGQFNIQLYPNPSSEKIKITINPNIYQEDSEIEIFNMFGELVHQSILTNPVSEINIQDFSKGMYFYYLKNKAQQISKGKFIKN